MVYDYVIVDSKLLCYNMGFHRRQHASSIFSNLAVSLRINKIKFKKILYAADWNKSSYRLKLQPDYKGHRKNTQSKETTEEQVRRELFLQDYKGLHKYFDVLGCNLQKLDSEFEADDQYNLVRYLKPEANILLISLDYDWYTNVISTGKDTGNTHLLKFTKNEMFKTGIDVEKLYKIPFTEMIKSDALKGQAKDNIHSPIVKFGTGRFMKYLSGKPEEEWWSILQDLVKKGKYGIKMNPKAKHKGLLQQYHHNLLLMNPAPVSEFSEKEIQYVKTQLDREVKGLNYHEFLLDFLKHFSTIPVLTKEDFTLLQNGTET